VGKVAVGNTPPVFTPEGRFLFVLGTPESISMIDTSTDNQVATLPVPALGANPGRPRFTYFVVVGHGCVGHGPRTGRRSLYGPLHIADLIEPIEGKRLSAFGEK